MYPQPFSCALPSAQTPDGTGWMPAVFLTDLDTEPEGALEAADEADVLEEASDEVEAHALAA